MVESVDTKDLKSFGYCSCAGSSPASGTKQHSPAPHRSIRSCVRSNFLQAPNNIHQHHAGRNCCCRLCSCSRRKYAFSSTAKIVIAVDGCVLAPGAKQYIFLHRTSRTTHTKHTYTHPHFVRYTLMATNRAACAYLLAYFNSYNSNRSDRVLSYISITNNRSDRYAHSYFVALCKTRPA